MREKISFIFYHDTEEILEALTGEQCKQLMLSLCNHSKTGNSIDIEDPIVKAHFTNLKIIMDRDNKKYQDVCERRAKGGKKGGRPKKP